jgi:hypothetical protein
MVSLPFVTLLLTQAAWAHFNLNYPETIGFNDEAQHDGPCGGFTPDFAKNTFTDFHTGGDAVATVTTHVEGTWLYRITLDETASGNWTQAFPIVRQNGLGAFCEPIITIPTEFVGQKGILGAVTNTSDGLLFQVRRLRSQPSPLYPITRRSVPQCAAVNFVEGTTETQRRARTHRA